MNGNNNSIELSEILTILNRLEKKVDLLYNNRNEKLLDPTDAAKYINKARSTLDRYTAKGILHPEEIKTGSYTKKYYRESELNMIKK